MKIIRGIFNTLIGVVLTILLFALSISLIVKNVLKEKVLVNVVKETVINEYINNEDSNIPEEVKEIIYEHINDKKVEDMFNLVINNYIEFTNNENYTVNQKTVDKIIDFGIYYKDEISEFVEEDITEDMIREYVTYENINRAAKEGFPNLDKELGEDIKNVVVTYGQVTSNNSKLILVIGIIFVIVLLMLINWSLYRWMLTTGISSIISGILVSIMYFGADLIKNILIEQNDLGISLDTISFNDIIIIGISEVTIGIILIVIYSLIKKGSKNKDID